MILFANRLAAAGVIVTLALPLRAWIRNVHLSRRKVLEAAGSLAAAVVATAGSVCLALQLERVVWWNWYALMLPFAAPICIGVSADQFVRFFATDMQRFSIGLRMVQTPDFYSNGKFSGHQSWELCNRLRSKRWPERAQHQQRPSAPLDETAPAAPLPITPNAIAPAPDDAAAAGPEFHTDDGAAAAATALPQTAAAAADEQTVIAAAVVDTRDAVAVPNGVSHSAAASNGITSHARALTSASGVTVILSDRADSSSNERDDVNGPVFHSPFGQDV